MMAHFTPDGFAVFKQPRYRKCLLRRALVSRGETGIGSPRWRRLVTCLIQVGGLLYA
jgi:hypothetical protein